MTISFTNAKGEHCETENAKDLLKPENISQNIKRNLSGESISKLNARVKKKKDETQACSEILKDL